MNPPSHARESTDRRHNPDDRYRGKEQCYDMMGAARSDYRKTLLWLLATVIGLYVGSLALFDRKVELVSAKTELLLERSAEARVGIYQRIGEQEKTSAAQTEQIKSVRETQERTFQALGSINTKLDEIQKEIK